MSEQPQAGDVWVKNGFVVFIVLDEDDPTELRMVYDDGSSGGVCPDLVEKATLLVRNGQPVPQPAPQPAGDVIEVAVMESSDRGRHVYAVGQLGQTAALHAARSFTPDRHIATIRAVLPPRSVPVVEGTVTTK